MRLATVLLTVLCLGVLLVASSVSAATVTSSFNLFVYSYTVTPALGETIMDFHVYASYSEANIAEYTHWVMPAGWNFSVTQLTTTTALNWWTTTDPLPVGVASTFGYTHYCAPCCHSWFVSGTGTSSPYDPPIDGSWNHPTEMCNIPAPFDDVCGGGGLVVAPIYPEQTPVESSTWTQLKALYH